MHLEDARNAQLYYFRGNTLVISSRTLKSFYEILDFHSAFKSPDYRTYLVVNPSTLYTKISNN